MIGKTLGHYKILNQLGRGGMGEVYLAEDLSLDRKVALKFLPEAFTSDPERMARFEREAKLLASLNHPNIAAIYGLEQADGKRFLIMEYVGGETLQAKISKGALPVEDALALCHQIVEGLEAAHEKGVIHRDLKPANVMITGEEKVKILDFGLAKALADEIQSIDSSQSPTITEAMTQPGVVLGTAAYMSPEQAKGKAVDKRADIWAFGCILHECLSGRKVFEGETVTETLAAVMRGEPDWEKLPTDTPQNIRFVLRRCLEKDRNRRFRDAADVLIEIEEVRDLIIDNVSTLTTKSTLTWVWAVIASIMVIVLAVPTFLYFRQEKPEPAMCLQVPVPPMHSNHGMAISPDGRLIAFVARTSESGSALYIRKMDEITPRQLEGTDGALLPFWAPDSRSIAFFTDRMLKRVDVSGGLPQELCSIVSTYFLGGTWNGNDIIVFSCGFEPLYSIPAAGGEPLAITVFDESQNETAHAYPCFLPDGKHFLYTAYQPDSDGDIYLGALDSDTRIKILTDVSKTIYAEPGYLLYHSGRTLFARTFDDEKFTFSGEAFGIADNLLVDGFGSAAFSASRSGLLIHRSGKDQLRRQFVLVDRNGNQLDTIGEPALFSEAFDLSFDGSKIVTNLRDSPTFTQSNIWLIEKNRPVLSQLTFNSETSGDAVWSPDGLYFAFSILRNGSFNIYKKKADGTGEETLVLKLPENLWIEDWSKDGQYIAYGAASNPTNLYALDLFDDQKPLSINESNYDKDEPHFSYNVKWVAYGSKETGTWQVYVVSFPAMENKRMISSNGGGQPRWRRDGKELYYLALDGRMMAVDISGEEKIEPAMPRTLFETGLIVDPNVDQYAVTPDGQSFVLLKPLEETTSTPITVIVNWTKLLEK